MEHLHNSELKEQVVTRVEKLLLIIVFTGRFRLHPGYRVDITGTLAGVHVGGVPAAVDLHVRRLGLDEEPIGDLLGVHEQEAVAKEPQQLGGHHHEGRGTR